MDITTIVGVIVGFGLIVSSILKDGSIMNFVDPASLLIVIGGTLAAVFASFPLSTLKNMGKHFKIITQGKSFQPEPLIESLVEMAQLARKNGLLALEEKANELEDPFYKRSIMLIVDATEAEKVKEMLEAELESMAARHDEETAIYDKGASFAPAFGMIGTLIGLINMLKSLNLDEGGSDTIGSSMSVALITTLYGVLVANLIFSPISQKLQIRNSEEILYRQIIIDGVLGIQAGDNPKSLKESLVASLKKKQQAQLLDGEGGGGGKPKKEKKGKKDK
ncbi:MAG: motility protein A [Firmicutes bacterium]|jgi:chemotaxis protein MotA|nr:motility protein A [Bacillota bacterium]